MSVIVKGKAFALGLVLAAGFGVVLVFLFAPVCGGRTGLVWADEVFNGLAKGSVYCIDELGKSAAGMQGTRFRVALKPPPQPRGLEAAMLLHLRQAGCDARPEGGRVQADGDLGKVLAAALTDADDMHFNRGREVSARGGGMDERLALLAWWHVLEQLDRQFRKDGLAREDELCQLVMTKAVEPSYNFYGVKPERVKDHPVMVAGFLGFYVLYTVWLGSAIYFIFKGLGLRAARKPEPAVAAE